MNTLVSIIIPSYGGGQYLARSIDSVLNQTYKNVEVIVVDDNGIGTNNQLETSKIIDKYKDVDNVKYICHEVNKNGSAARNTGARASSGEYLGFLDDDDEYLPHFVQMHLDEFENLADEYALTYCSADMYCGDTYVDTRHNTKSGSLLYEVLSHKAVIGSSVLLIKKSVFDELGGFDESFRRHQDWEFTARVAARYKIKAIDVIGGIGYYEFRNTPTNYEIAKKYRVHFVEKMMPYINMLSPCKQKKVICSNYVSLILSLLRKGQIKKFITEFKYFNLGFRGIFMVIESMFSYVFVNRNFWTRKKKRP